MKGAICGGTARGSSCTCGCRRSNLSLALGRFRILLLSRGGKLPGLVRLDFESDLLFLVLVIMGLMRHHF